MCWLRGCYRWFPPCSHSCCRQIWGRCWLSFLFICCFILSKGNASKFRRSSDHKKRDLHCVRKGFSRVWTVCTPKCSSGYTKWDQAYSDPHADELIEIVPKVIVVDEFDQDLDFVCVVLEAGPAFVELLYNVSDLPSRLSYMNTGVRCISCDFSRLRFLLSFLLSLRLSAADKLHFLSQLSSVES